MLVEPVYTLYGRAIKLVTGQANQGTCLEQYKFYIYLLISGSYKTLCIDKLRLKKKLFFLNRFLLSQTQYFPHSKDIEIKTHKFHLSSTRNQSGNMSTTNMLRSESQNFITISRYFDTICSYYKCLRASNYKYSQTTDLILSVQ